MTFSIVAYDPHTQAAGVATATGEMSVGGYVPYAKAGVGACATQGNFTNWLYGEKIIHALSAGSNASVIAAELKEQDNGFEHRQLLIVDNHGRLSGWTGTQCADNKGQIYLDGFGVAGNILTNTHILGAMAETFAQYQSVDFEMRLLLALEAGQAAGGDARGLMSAALKVDYLDRPPVDIRIDHHVSDAISELKILLKRITNSPFSDFYTSVPTRTHFSKPEND